MHRMKLVDWSEYLHLTFLGMSDRVMGRRLNKTFWGFLLFWSVYECGKLADEKQVEINKVIIFCKNISFLKTTIILQ